MKFFEIDMKQQTFSKLEIVALILVVFMSLADVGTTYVGLSLPGVTESNPITASKWANGTWALWEIMITGSFLLISLSFMHILWFEYKHFFLIGMFSFSLVRSFCVINNINIIMGVLHG